VFWNEAIAEMRGNKVPDSTATYYKTQTKRLYEEHRSDLSGKELPTIQGSFTNWKPVQMKELSRLCLQVTSG